MASRQIIVVGGGLSGLSAAHTILEHGGRVIVLDKNAFLGGNSTKATSGINGALTKTQIRLGIPDSVEAFYEDTARSARKAIRPPLVKVLTGNSAPSVEWLQEKFGLDLSLVSRLGGQSFPRTHRGKERFPGMTITYALMEKLDDISKENPDVAHVVLKARVTRLLVEEGTVVGVEYEKDGKVYQERGPVVICTGGFAADFSEDSLLKKYTPQFYNLPTTNGDHCTGDGIKMAIAIGGNTADIKNVQVHPTGLVDPQEPDAKVKFLAAEALRGVGGLLLTAEGKRFCDELGHRDYVTGEMWKNKAPFRLVLNGAGSKEIEWHCKHYCGRGLMKRYPNGAALAADMGIPVSVLEATFKDYNDICEKKKPDPYGKKFFHNFPFRVDDEFHVSIVTPVLHYCMGGLEINADSEVLSVNGSPIAGLYAAGEAAGGIHGENRLGGSSLLDCVVFGRVAGASASKYLFSKLLTDAPTQQTATKRVATIAGQLPDVSVTESDLKVGATVTQPNVSTRVEVEPNSRRLSLEIVWNDQGNVVSHVSTPSVAVSAPVTAQRALDAPKSSPAPSTDASTPAVAPPAAASPAAASPAAASQPDRNKEWTLEEVAKHNTDKDCWVVVNGQVLDVTHFLKDHPGGKKAIMIYAGRDASEEFNMLHKPDVVEKYAPESIIGKLKGGAAAGHEASAATEAAPQPVSQMKPSNVESLVSGGTADILPKERARATFEVEKLTNLLDGGPEGTKRRRFILTPTEGLDLSDKYNWERPEQMKQHVKHFIKVHEDFWETFKPTRDDVVWMSENSMISGSLMNHYGLFLPSIEAQATEEQKEWWLGRARTMKITGCYAQTELGHGSNVRGLMTTAEYDKKTQTFVLNTPTLRSIKWWPGTLGKVATHALVYAQLIIDGKEYGVHAFMIQVRDENHKPLPGITLGDLGPKLGDHANDTGFMVMQNVRIPREFMLARFQHVTPEGEYVKSESRKKNAKLHYATMMFTRGAMVKTAGGYLARAATIAARYSCVRTQGFKDTSRGASYKSEERQIIDYQVQRYRILRQVALAYAIKFTGSWMLHKFKDLEGSRDDKDKSVNRLSNLEALPEIAATSAGLKAMCTFLASQGIEDCRKCCGGNGYLMASGVASLAADYVWQTTAEGDWILMMHLTARFLMKALRSAMEGKPVPGPVSYLAPLKDLANFNLQKLAPAPAKSHQDFFNLDYLLQLFQYRALVAVVSVGEEFQKKLGELNGKFDEAWNACALELIDSVKAHCFAFLLTNFEKAARKAGDEKLSAVLTQLCALFACSNILDDSQWTGILSAGQARLVKRAVTELLDLLRPNTIALVDAFDLPDRVLNSTIGRYDGNVYEALYEAALKSQLNKKDPFDGYEEYLRPHLDLEFLKSGNKAPSKL